MTEDPRRVASDYLASLTESESADFIATARAEHTEMRAFAAVLFRKDEDDRPFPGTTRHTNGRNG